MPMKNIAFFQRDFQVGGIQKALLNLLQALDFSRYSVDVYHFDPAPFYDLPKREGLRFILLKPFPYIARFVPFSLLLSSPFPFQDRYYDLAVDFNSYSPECAVGALTVRAGRRVMWIHNDMRIKYGEERKYRVLWHFFKAKFQLYDCFAAVSGGIVSGFRVMTGLDDVPVTVIPNCIDTSEIFRKAEQYSDIRVNPAEYNLCSMGRFVHQKGFDLLLDDFARVRKKRNDMRLYLIGDGPERQALESQVAKLCLGNSVTLLGSLSNPFPVLSQMDGFALTSRYEGQGIVLWEARALGLELFMSKRLEQYNPALHGYEDIVSPLLEARKKEKQRDDLSAYNTEVMRCFDSLL